MSDEAADDLDWNDEDFVLTRVKASGWDLRLAPSKMRDRRRIVLGAVRSEPFALMWASETLKNDTEVVTLAVGKYWDSLGFASTERRDDPGILSIALKQTGAALQHASLRASVARWGEVGRAPRLLQRIVRASREPCVALSLGGPRHAPLDLLLGREAGPRRRRPRRRSLCPKRVDAAPPASPRQPRRRGARPLRPHHGTPTQNHPNPPRYTLSPAPLFESRSWALES